MFSTWYDSFHGVLLTVLLKYNYLPYYLIINYYAWQVCWFLFKTLMWFSIDWYCKDFYKLHENYIYDNFFYYNFLKQQKYFLLR